LLDRGPVLVERADGPHPGLALDAHIGEPSRIERSFEPLGITQRPNIAVEISSPTMNPAPPTIDRAASAASPAPVATSSTLSPSLTSAAARTAGTNSRDQRPT
jgi:hypothetical protein